MTFDAQAGLRLREARDRLGISQHDLAVAAGIRREMLSRYERGAAEPGATVLIGLANSGIDVMYVLSGQRSTAPNAPAEAHLATLADRGIRWGAGDQQDEVHITPTGLMWLLNFLDQNDDGKPVYWGIHTLTRLAQFEPHALRGLSVQVVKLCPYDAVEVPQLIFYLDRSPPSRPLSFPPGAGLQARYELDNDSWDVPVILPDRGYVLPVFVLDEPDIQTLRRGGVCRFDRK